MVEGVSGLMRGAVQRLKAHGIASAALDARLLLQAALGVGHADIIAEPNFEPNPFQLQAFEDFIGRRLKHEPVSKILGVREFYGRNFQVTADVLDPRADTETLIDAALPMLSPSGASRILDLGCGSGAIIITLLAERTLASGVAVDLSAAARHVTMRNGINLGVAGRLQVLAGPWFELVGGSFDLIVSNPPYIRHVDLLGLPADVYNYDPHLALDGGADGLDCYRAIALGCGTHLAKAGQVLVEIGVGQAGEVADIFVEAGFNPAERHRDLAGHVRVLAFTPV